jgi:hypothetical protein
VGRNVLRFVGNEFLTVSVMARFGEVDGVRCHLTRHGLISKRARWHRIADR